MSKLSTLIIIYRIFVSIYYELQSIEMRDDLIDREMFKMYVHCI